eukprot:s1483_g16.t1
MAAKDAVSAASTLRLWKRQRARALEVGASLPDLMIQVKALDTIVMNVLHKQPQASFRVSTFRMEAHLDERPTDAAVEQYLELIMAEMDYISHSVGTPQEKVKVLQGSPQQPGKTGDRPYKYWGASTGCKHGPQRRFTHGPLPKDGVERCWHCSAPGHRKPDCPALASGNGQSPAKTGGSQPGGQNGQSPGGNRGVKKGGKGQQKGATSPPSTPSRDGNGGSGQQKGDGSNNSKGKKGGGKGDKPSPGTSTSTPTKEEGQVKKLDTGTAENLLTEVSTLIKTIKTEGNKDAAQLKVISLKRLEHDPDGAVLQWCHALPWSTAL